MRWIGRGAAALALAAASLSAQQPPIGIIEFYGLHRLDRGPVLAALGVRTGDSLPAESGPLLARLRSLPGVEDARVNPVCCEEGRTILYVGIVESGAKLPQWNAPPRGEVVLPDSIRRLGEAFQDSLWAALMAGDAAEDRSAGHSLMHYPGARRLQEQFLALAAANPALLREVLHHSAVAGDRSLAAQILGYARDKSDCVPDLLSATRDPAVEVRNSAVRALAVAAAAHDPVPIPMEPFVALLHSPEWTDRNKASLALMALAASADAAALAALQPVRPELVEMAQWKALGHASPALYLLGRMAGMNDQQIAAAIEQNDRSAILARHP